MPSAAASWSARARRCARSRIVLRDVNWIGEGSIEEALADDRREVFVKVRSTRPPQAGWLAAANGGYEVELVDGEDGVSPGQACVFYDAGVGQARVLGGGFIKSAVAAADGACAPINPWRRQPRAADFAHDPEKWNRFSERSCAGDNMGADIDKSSVERAYARWAPIYDLVFGAVFERGRRAAIVAAERIGGRILEVGVGTGISLPDYARSNRLVGVDLSEPMLRKAQARVAEHGLSNVEALAVMDAERLALPDQSFDVVVAQFVITAVPNPEATLDEFARVIKPGGEIVLVNHIGAESGPRRLFEICFAPLARRLGWRPEFRFGRLGRLGRAPRRRARDRAHADAAARAFLADPFRAPGRRRAPQRGVNGGACRAGRQIQPKCPIWNGF